MRKILIAFDGTHFSIAALEFAFKLHQASPVMLVGAFVPQTDIASLWAYVGGHDTGAKFVPLVGDDDGEALQGNIKRFENYCIDRGIEYRVHKDYFDFAIPELMKETRFADLLIISSESFYADMGKAPNEYLQETLHDVECPVILVPDQFSFPTVNVLTYDGSAASVFAIKLFAYLLPEMVDNKTILVYAKANTSEPLPDELNVEELVGRHFKDFSLLRFEPDRKKHFNSWLTELNESVLVSGSFGRSGLYRLFHKSFVAETIKDEKLPLFIAHR